jgi:CBS domain-containing protein
MLNANEFDLIDNSFLSRSVGLLNPVLPETIGEGASIKDVLGILQQKRIGCVVVTGKDGELSGIFTERDVVLKVIGKSVDCASTNVGTLMTKNPQSIQMDTSMAFSLNLMSGGGYRHLPIVDEHNVPVGIVSIKDIVDFIVKSTFGKISRFVD